MLPQTTLPGETWFWLFGPMAVMFVVALIHSLRNWNRPS